VPTRNCEKEDFVKWFGGPRFLYEGSEENGFFNVSRRMRDCDVLLESWKTGGKSTSNSVTLSIASEIHVMASSSDTVKQDQNISTVIDISRFSTYEKLVNTTAYVLRFIANIKARIKDGRQLVVEECLKPLRSNVRSCAG